MSVSITSSKKLHLFPHHCGMLKWVQNRKQHSCSQELLRRAGQGWRAQIFNHGFLYERKRSAL